MLLCPRAAMFRIKRDFPWFNVMAWLSREILVYDSQGRLVAGVTRVWHPLNRMCAFAERCCRLTSTLPYSPFTRPRMECMWTPSVCRACLTKRYRRLHQGLCRYDLYHVPVDEAQSEEPVLTMFGQISVPFWAAIFTWRYPVTNPAHQEVTSVERIFGSGIRVRHCLVPSQSRHRLRPALCMQHVKCC
jgi:hypothetical protein